jgi:hypothetical protein
VWLALVHSARTLALSEYRFLTIASSLRTVETPRSIAVSMAAPAATWSPMPLAWLLIAVSNAAMSAFKSARKSAGISCAMNCALSGVASVTKG